MIIPLELRRAIAKSEALASIVKGYRGYNRRKYYIYYKKRTIENKTIWVFKRNKF